MIVDIALGIVLGCFLLAVGWTLVLGALVGGMWARDGDRLGLAGAQTSDSGQRARREPLGGRRRRRHPAGPLDALVLIIASTNYFFIAFITAS
jgi:hypothetical protein